MTEAATPPPVPQRTGEGRPSPLARRSARLFLLLLLACALSLAAGVPFAGHGPFEIAALFGFYAAAGLVSGAIVIGIGLMLRPLIVRGEGYYRD